MLQLSVLNVDTMAGEMSFLMRKSSFCLDFLCTFQLLLRSSYKLVAVL